MTDDLLDKFEVVADESGQEFVKLVFTDDNNEPTGYALVTPEDAKKILSGEATLQSTVDSEGKQIITLAPVIQSDQPKPNEDSNLDGVLAVDNLDEAIESDSKQDMLSPIKQASKDVPRSETNLISMGPSAGVDNQDAAPEGVEQYTISEETVIINGIHMQLVTLIDSQGNVIDQKRGRPGEEVAIEMHGQAFMYQMQGPLEGGEQLTSTLYVSSGEPDDQVPADVTQHTPEGWSDLKDSTDDIGVPTHPIPEGDPASVAEAAGQQYTLTEAMAIVDGEAMQTVILEDSQGNVLDQKQGRRGDRAMISIHGHSLEYVFLGPTETGEAITTTLVVTTDSDIGPDSESALSSLDAPATALGAPRTEVSEAETPSGAAASTWVPAGLDVNFYTALRRQVEAMVSNRFSRPDAPVYAPEHVYHPRLGSRQAHLEMLQLVASYRPGLANRESLERYEVLRGYARIYRPSGPHSRALTRNELALNEAAAQICRFKPALLFHKRELFCMAKECVERSQIWLGEGQQSQQQQQTISSSLEVVEGQTPAVLGRQMASSQLAMLESKGLVAATAPQHSTAGSMLVVGTTEAQGIVRQTGVGISPSIDGAAQGLRPILSRSGIDTNLLTGLSGSGRRDIVYKLVPAEEEALQRAVVEVLSEIPNNAYDLKPRPEATGLEAACYEQAVSLARAIPGLGLNMATPSGLLGLITNQVRLEAVRDLAAIHGRSAASGAGGSGGQGTASASVGGRIPGVLGNAGSPAGMAPPPLPPGALLTPYEVACNEAAAYLASGMPALLTHRRDLADLAKKAVRLCGCIFSHTPTTLMDKIGGGYRFYCSDQMSELDLSAAERLLTNSLEENDEIVEALSALGLHSITSGSLSPAISESSTDTDHELLMSCEECNNTVDEIAIYTATGTDTFKRVRILNLSNCSYTGILPVHLNQCINLIELNLFGNCLRAFPRCLYLPALKRLNLRGNPRLLKLALRGHRLAEFKSVGNGSGVTGCLPLFEQFPRLNILEVDLQMLPLIKRQALAYLCPHLKLINSEEFDEQPSDETIKTAQHIKSNLSNMIHSKWEDDIADFFKKGVPKREAIKVIETLVMHAVKVTPVEGDIFSHCRDVLARRIAEDFLMPKIMDEEEDDEAAGGNQRSEEELIRLREDSDYESSSCSDSHSDATSGGSESGLEDDELGNAIHGDQTTGTTSETVAANVVSSGPVDADGLATTICQAIVEPAVGESCQEAKEVGLSTVNGVGGTSTKVEEVDGFNASLSSAVDQNSEKPVVLPCAVDPPGKKPTALQKKERRRRERAVKARAAVAAREAEAAAANLALLPEEPLDRLSNVVGQALRAGKTVVYSVMRSAARQPNGELIPVGGGGGGSSFMMGGSGGSTSGLMVGLGGSQNASGIGHMTHMSIAHSNISNLGSYASLGVDKIQTGNIADDDSLADDIDYNSNNGHSEHVIYQRSGYLSNQSTASHAPIGGAMLGTRRPGLLNAAIGLGRPRGRPPLHYSAGSGGSGASTYSSIDQGSTAIAPIRPRSSGTGPYISSYTRSASRDYLLDALEEAELASPPQPKPAPQPWAPGKRGRPPLAMSLAKKAAAAQAEADETTSILQNIAIPPPHEPPPASFGMSTRNSNRLKRFSNYGVIDTAAAKAGKEEALMAAAFALVDAEETEEETQPIEKDHISEPSYAPSERAGSQTPGRRATSANIDSSDEDFVASEEGESAANAAAGGTPGAIVKRRRTLGSSSTGVSNGSAATDASSLAPPVLPCSIATSGLSFSTARRGRPLRQSSLRARQFVIDKVEEMAAADYEDYDVDSGMETTSSNFLGATGHARPEVLEISTKQDNSSILMAQAEYEDETIVGSEDVTPLLNQQRRSSSQSSAIAIKSLSSLGEVVDYDPLHFIRCHARDNDPLDCETKVWRCAFEPNPLNPTQETTNVVATCGGECVCLIDCRTGKVMKRFKHQGEEFYTLAWTTVEMAGGHHRTNLLAAAGRLREIRLLHPEQLVCYAEMKGHREDVGCMLFHPQRPTILFSGDAKAQILVWDIGIPSAPEYRTRHQLLMRLECPRPNLNPVLNLVFLPNYDALLAGCEDGVFTWLLKDIKKEKLSPEREPDLEIKLPTRREPCFDGLAKLSDRLIVIKCVEEGEIYIFDFLQVLTKRRRNGHKKNVLVDVIGQLRWQTTDEIYINVCARPELSAVICGDNEGTIWLYDLSQQINISLSGRIQKPMEEEIRKFKAKPVKILEWPECSVGGAREDDTQLKESLTSGFKNPVVNTTDISSDGKYLAAVTDNNLVCIWNFTG